MQSKVMFARFPFGNSEVPDAADWLIPTILQAKSDPRIAEVHHMKVDDTPITMGRNHVLKECLRLGIDYVVMLDSDMKPDLPGLGAKPFWPTAFDFVWKHEGPCVVAAPYCGPPPIENVYIFRWAKWQDDNPNTDLRLEQYSREEASQRAGFERVAALPTGLIIIAMEGVKRLTPPWFDYEWADPPYNSKKASTEDVFFTRNLDLVDVPQYVLWDSWAGHWKRKCVGKPSLVKSSDVSRQFQDALERGHKHGEVLVEIGCPGNGRYSTNAPSATTASGANAGVDHVGPVQADLLGPRGGPPRRPH